MNGGHKGNMGQWEVGKINGLNKLVDLNYLNF